MVVTLAEAKLHLRVTQDAEDTLIRIYINAATSYIRKFLNREIPGYADSPAIVDDAIRGAALLIIGDLYLNREAGSEAEITPNPSVMNLLYPFRVNIGI